MAFEVEKQKISASQLMQAIADGEEIKLSLCTVTGVLDINRFLEPEEKFDTSNLDIRRDGDCTRLTLPQYIVFDRCTFEDNVVFSGPWSQPESISVEFKVNVIFNRSIFRGQSRFRNAVFRGDAGFDGCAFDGVATFRKAVFHAEAKFRTAAFNGYCLLGESIYHGPANFTNTHFVRGANLSDVVFLGPTNFAGVYSSSRSVPEHSNICFARGKYGDDESFWRFVKQSASDAGYYQMAGESFYRERCARLRQKFLGDNFDSLGWKDKALRVVGGVRLLPEVAFGKWLFGYGERPIRILTFSLLIILICGLIFSADGALSLHGQPQGGSFLQGLYFSTITFTTLGYGDLYPTADTIYRQVAMIEAASGALLVALFVVAMAKRFSRS